MKKLVLLSWIPIFGAVLLARQGLDEASWTAWVTGITAQWIIGLRFFTERERCACTRSESGLSARTARLYKPVLLGLAAVWVAAIGQYSAGSALLVGVVLYMAYLIDRLTELRVEPVGSAAESAGNKGRAKRTTHRVVSSSTHETDGHDVLEIDGGHITLPRGCASAIAGHITAT
jgi:hypothetical protein